MQITVNDDIGEKIRLLPNPDEFVNSILGKALLKRDHDFTTFTASEGLVKISFLITRCLKEPLDAVVEKDGDGFIARTPDIPLYGFGDDPVEAVGNLRYEIESLFDDLTEDDEFTHEWLRIREFLRECKN